MMMLNIFEYQYNFVFHFSMGSWKQNIWIKLEKISLRGRGMFDNGNGNWCMLGRAFVSNRTFLCRTMYFCVEPGIFVSNRGFLCRTSVIIHYNSALKPEDHDANFVVKATSGAINDKKVGIIMTFRFSAYIDIFQLFN